MATLDELPIGTTVEFKKFDDWKRYADAMGYWSYGAAETPGCWRMTRYLGKLADVPAPPQFSFKILPPN